MRLRAIARGARRGMALVGLGLAGGAAVVAVRHALMTPQPLASGLPGEGRLDRQHGGDVYYAVAGPEDGLPVVLLHDFYPGASNYEFRAIYGRLAETYRVYAPDWLGFGMSERPPLVLTGEFYAMMLVGFLRDVVGRPAVVVARGRAANIAARAAADEPALFDRLALVGPDLEAGERLDPTAGQVAARLFQRVSLGLAPYAMMSLRPALRLAEGLRSAVGPGLVDEETVDHLYASAHQFGGQYGAMALLTGELDLPIQNVFPTLEPPALVVVGERDQDLPLSRLERLVALNPHADLEVILSAGATVYQDQPKLFVGALHRWLGRRIARQTARIEAWTVAEAAERTTERVAAPVMAERATPALAEAVAPAAVAQSPKLEAAPAAVVAIEDVPAEASETPSPTLAELMETPEEADAASKDVTAPVKIVPVLDTADGSDAPQVHAGEPRMQTRVAPRQERKTAPRTEPKPEAQAKAKVKAKPEAKAPRPTARPKGAAKARSEAKPSAEKAGSKAKLSTEKAGSRAKPKAQEAPATPSPRKRAGAAKTSSSGTAPRRRKQPGEG